MTDADQPPSPDRVQTLLTTGAHEEAVACLAGLDTADGDDRKRVIRAVREVVERDGVAFEALAEALAPFLTDDERAVRLSAAKLFVALARAAPAVVLPAVETVGDRLADDAEFYYVRARCAETLGYVGRDYPAAVSDPAVLAQFTVGLALDEPEVREKLAKALEHVALGDPDRLRHHVADLAAHLDDENELVRYHLATALVVVGTADPGRLAAAGDALEARLSDSNPYVRGRAAEAIGLSDEVDAEAALRELRDSDESFVAARGAFATTTAAATDATDEPLGTVASVEATTERAAETIAKPDDDGDCPHCGCSLPGDGPPMCPQCGAPR